MVVREADPVQRRVAHIDVGRSHVDPGPQHHRPLAVAALAHLAEPRHALVGGAPAKRGIAPGLGQRSARLAHLVGALLVHVRVSGADQEFGVLVQLIEIVRRVVQVAVRALGPVEADPVHRVQYRIDVFLLLLFRIGVVEAHVAAPTVVARKTEIQADRFGVPDVQIAVRFRRKAGAYPGRVRLALPLEGSIAGTSVPAAPRESARGQVRVDDIADEIGRCRRPRGVASIHG